MRRRDLFRAAAGLAVAPAALAVAAAVPTRSALAAGGRVTPVRAVIGEKGPEWVAGVTSVFGLTPAEHRLLERDQARRIARVLDRKAQTREGLRQAMGRQPTTREVQAFMRANDGMAQIQRRRLGR